MKAKHVGCFLIGSILFCLFGCVVYYVGGMLAMGEGMRKAHDDGAIRSSISHLASARQLQEQGLLAHADTRAYLAERKLPKSGQTHIPKPAKGSPTPAGTPAPLGRQISSFRASLDAPAQAYYAKQSALALERAEAGDSQGAFEAMQEILDSTKLLLSDHVSVSHQVYPRRALLPAVSKLVACAQAEFEAASGEDQERLRKRWSTLREQARVLTGQTLGPSPPAAAKTQPAKTQPAKTQPAKTEPAETER
jgi:hypothetical protein